MIAIKLQGENEMADNAAQKIVPGGWIVHVITFLGIGVNPVTFLLLKFRFMPDFGEPEYRCLTSDRTWATEPGRLSLLPEHHSESCSHFMCCQDRGSCLILTNRRINFLTSGRITLIMKLRT